MWDYLRETAGKNELTVIFTWMLTLSPLKAHLGKTHLLNRLNAEVNIYNIWVIEKF